MLNGLMKQQMMSILIVSLFHFWGGYVQPLFLQIFISWKTLLFHQLSQIHLFGKSATGDLVRPFVQPNPLSFLEPSKDTPQTTVTSENNKKKN
ncbi:hypothetical protein HMI56_000368 [Coelomomyces lativittatus]|nr:hypothetical protein HMI56_000368 [Coelomomyces lativittatus]